MLDLRVTSIEQLGSHTLKLLFNDGHVSVINFLPYITNHKNEMVTDYIDSTLFNGYKLDNGNVNWNDYDMIFSVNDLYDGKIFM